MVEHYIIGCKEKSILEALVKDLFENPTSRSFTISALSMCDTF
jgi:hypothetical protein